MIHHLLFHRRRKVPNYSFRRVVLALVVVLAGVGYLAHGCSPAQPTTSQEP